MVIRVDPAAEVHPSVILEGDVAIGAFTTVGAGTVIMGEVVIGHHCNICCNVVVRGRNQIGSWVHIYDQVLIEGGRPGGLVGGNINREPDRSLIADWCWINHGATMHGSRMAEGAVLDLNACLDYNCRLGKGVLVTNGTALHYDSVIPDNCVVEGVPGVIIKRDITDQDRRQRMGLVPREWIRYAGERAEARIRGDLDG